MLSFTIAHVVGHPAADHRARRRAPVPRAGQHARSAAATLPLFAVVGGIGTGAGVRRRHRAAPRRRASPASAGWRSASPIYIALPPPPGPRPDDDDEGRRPAPGRRPRGGVRVGARRVRRRRTSTASTVATAAQARRAAPARDPRARDDHRPELVADRRAAARARRWPRRRIIEQAKVQGGRRVTGHCDEGPRRPGGPRHRRGGERDARAGDRACRCRRARARRCSARRSRPCSPSGPCRVIIESPARSRRATALGRYAAAASCQTRVTSTARRRGSCRRCMVVHRRRC